MFTYIDLKRERNKWWGDVENDKIVRQAEQHKVLRD